MAGFGGAVKLTGESEYRKALQQITQNLREVSSEMRTVSSQYDKNDKSVDALNAKSSSLNKTLELQVQKLNTLKSQYSTMSSQYEKQAQKHSALNKEYETEKTKLSEIEKTLGKTSQEYKDQSEKVTTLGNDLKKSSSAMESNEKAMSNMRIQINNAQTDINNTDKAIKELGEDTEDAGKKAEKASNGGWTVFKSVLADLTATAIKGAINGVKQLGSATIALGKQAIASYAEYEQLIGGVETLFKDSASIVEGYANDAYKTAGLSANEYMETVTSFSASLLQSLDQDTEKASEYANRAIIDMSDNANKMGTNMASIQYAYQGFAKQNYTMLDNLKLGYGGTKEEMARLIADAAKMTDIQKELGITVDASSMSFGNIVNAISVVQSSLGIAGTTAKEASETIQGSASAMGSAWKNLLTGMADDNADFSQLIDNLVESVLTFGENILPRVQTTIQGMATMATGLVQKLVPEILAVIPPMIVETLPMLMEAVNTVLTTVLDVLPQVTQSLSSLIPDIVTMLLGMLPQIIEVGVDMILTLIDGINQALPQLIASLPKIIQDIVTTLVGKMPEILAVGVDMIIAIVDGLVQALPDLINYLPTIIDTTVTVLMNNLPLIVDAGIKLLVALINGIVQAIPQLISMLPRIITTIVTTLLQNAPKILNAGAQLMTSFAQGIGSVIGTVTGTIAKVVKSIIDGFKNLPKEMGNIGKNIVNGLIDGVKSLASSAVNAVKNFGKSLVSGVKSVLGINSPSKVFRDQIGKNLALGIEEGFTDEMKAVTNEMQNAIPTDFNVDTSVSGTNGYNSVFNYLSVVEAFKEALSEMKIELDDETMGKFVDKTVVRAVYSY